MVDTNEEARHRSTGELLRFGVGRYVYRPANPILFVIPTPLHRSTRVFRKSFIISIAGVAFAAASPGSSEAQLKKLGKAIGSRMVDKTITNAGNDSTNTATPATSSSAAPSTASVEITSERLTQFFAAIKPQMDEAKVRFDAIAKKKEYEEKSKAFEMCKVQIMQDPAEFQGMDDSDPAAIKVNKRLEVANAALENEIAKGTAMDQKKIAELNVEVQDILATQQLLSYPGIKKCGQRPVQPPEPSAASSSGTQLAASAKSNFSRNQFGLFRERVGAWVLTQGKGDQRITFTAGEQAVMKAHAKELAVLEPFFRDGSISWSYWGDLPSDWQ